MSSTSGRVVASVPWDLFCSCDVDTSIVSWLERPDDDRLTTASPRLRMAVRGGDASAVRRHEYVLDALFRRRPHRQAEQFLSAVWVPQLHRVIETPGHESAAVRQKRQVRHH